MTGPDSPEQQPPRRSHKPDDAVIGDDDLTDGEAVEPEDDLLDKSMEEPAKKESR